MRIFSLIFYRKIDGVRRGFRRFQREKSLPSFLPSGKHCIKALGTLRPPFFPGGNWCPSSRGLICFTWRSINIGHFLGAIWEERFIKKFTKGFCLFQIHSCDYCAARLPFRNGNRPPGRYKENPLLRVSKLYLVPSQIFSPTHFITFLSFCSDTTDRLFKI